MKPLKLLFWEGYLEEDVRARILAVMLFTIALSSEGRGNGYIVRIVSIMPLEAF